MWRTSILLQQTPAANSSLVTVTGHSGCLFTKMQLLALLLLIPTFSSTLLAKQNNYQNNSQMHVSDAGECSTCVAFMDQYLQELLNIILGGGVVDGCEQICSKLKASIYEQATCTILCGLIGVDGFVNLIKWADLDPIWMCDSLGLCTNSTCSSTCASIESVGVIPSSTKSGNVVRFSLSYKILSAAVGTSTIVVNVTNQAAPHFSSLQFALLPQPTPGPFSLTIPMSTMQTFPGGSQEPFPTGVYEVLVMLCGGMCGSHHAGSGILYARMHGADLTLTG